MRYTADYEIVRYDVHCFDRDDKLVAGKDFYQEEEAVKFASEYQKTHPEHTACIYKLERAVVLVEDD